MGPGCRRPLAEDAEAAVPEVVPEPLRLRGRRERHQRAEADDQRPTLPPLHPRAIAHSTRAAPCRLRRSPGQLPCRAARGCKPLHLNGTGGARGRRTAALVANSRRSRSPAGRVSTKPGRRRPARSWDGDRDVANSQRDLLSTPSVQSAHVQLVARTRRLAPPDASCASVSTGIPWRAQLGRSAAHTLHSQGSGAWSAPLSNLRTGDR
jgi:hypothetical protein